MRHYRLCCLCILFRKDLYIQNIILLSMIMSKNTLRKGQHYKRMVSMIKEIIEHKRQQLYQTIGISGLTSDETLHSSQELERFMTFHSRIRNSSSSTKVNEKKATVHSNAIYNILEVASREKLELPFEFNLKLIQHAEWYSIDVVHTLLSAISEKYGEEAVAYMGELFPARCIFPQTVQSFRESLQQLNQIFRLNHKSSSYMASTCPIWILKTK
jgi:hypothetical protein